LKKGWLAVQRRTFNTAILGSGLSMLGRRLATDGTDQSKSAGKLLQSKKIETRLQGAAAWHVRYLSKDVNDVPHEVTGIVIAPSKPGKDRPIITWCHGTTGLGDAACPSAQPDPARELTVYFNPGSTQQIDYGVPGVQGFLNAGYVVCATDYQGLGTSQTHQYMVSRTNARDAVFLGHAARELDAGGGTKLLSYGWSQGGGAAAAVAELDDADFGALDLRGSVLLSPGIASIGIAMPTGISAGLADASKAPDSHLLMMLWGYAAAYAKLNAADVFTPLGLQLMNDSWRVQPVHHLNDTAARMFRLHGALLKSPPLNFEAWKAAIVQASAGRVKPRCPLLMCVDGFAGGTVIPVPWQHAYAKVVRTLGGTIETREFPNDDHFSLPGTARDVVNAWVKKALAA
jgi:pimeloyl-ACP methyl ester carboxylesterase